MDKEDQSKAIVFTSRFTCQQNAQSNYRITISYVHGSMNLKSGGKREKKENKERDALLIGTEGFI